jgi:hypothetical protein
VFLSVFLFRNENVRRDPTKMHTGDVERSCPPEANRFDELRECDDVARTKKALRK